MNLANATIAQLMIPIDDFERGVSFYKDVLGLPFLFSAPPQMAFFMCGTVRLLIGEMPVEAHVVVPFAALAEFASAVPSLKL